MQLGNSVLATRRSDPELAAMLGFALTQLQRHEEGLAHLKRPIDLRPGHPDTLCIMAEVPLGSSRSSAEPVPSNSIE